MGCILRPLGGRSREYKQDDVRAEVSPVIQADDSEILAGDEQNRLEYGWMENPFLAKADLWICVYRYCNSLYSHVILDCHFIQLRG